ncbi:MAG TPA: UDP-N-acetylmuramate--L-alanine ligase [Acidimicrobiia bacterium]|nr:UDP-N-acetylmuramate--L-alanine ligase [Acidimicrobiia bacterium]
MLDLAAPRRVHVVGIGGSAMSAIATVLGAMGHRVTGSDLSDSAVVQRLGVPVAIGHRADNLPADADAVIVSTAIAADNPEVVEARRRGIPVLRRADAVRLFTAMRRTAVVSGTHGKTTTSSMLALILREAGWRPSFMIGGEVRDVSGNAVWDEGDWLVVEADESDGTFIDLVYEAAIVTNVEPDHLEHWGGFQPLVEAFERFVEQSSGPVVVCADDPGAAALSSVTYGFSEDATYRLSEFTALDRGGAFEFAGPDGRLGRLTVNAAGRHNALNAAGAAAMALELGVSFDAVAAALAAFAGVARRFEFRGDVGGWTVVDDYAHLPSEVRAAVAAAREGSWRRVVVVFQPHRFSRTATLWQDFAGAFHGADVVVLTDIYPAGEPPRPGVTGKLVLDAVLDEAGAERVVYLPTRDDLVRHVPGFAREGDVVLTLGAGDVTTLFDAWAPPRSR